MKKKKEKSCHISEKRHIIIHWLTSKKKLQIHFFFFFLKGKGLHIIEYKNYTIILRTKN